uniref:Uncharacterized protein n=1 Tax=Anguilla anguilla TaxID=7936 RepID=A0A0E9PCM7_ANGAN
MRMRAPLILFPQQSPLLMMVTEVIVYTCSRSTLHQGLSPPEVWVQDPWKKKESTVYHQ